MRLIQLKLNQRTRQRLEARARTPHPRTSAARIRNWYVRWVGENIASGTQPSRERDLKAAREALGGRVSRELLRDLRREIAPEAWRRFGRRKSAG